MAIDAHTQQPGTRQTPPNPHAQECAQAGADLRHAATALHRLAEAIEAPLSGDAFCKAVDAVVACAQADGTVLVSGLGKSGLIGSKLSATLASLGIPSHAVHPAEAAHGDLGRFRARDLALCLSHSGETEEVVSLAATLRQDGLPIIAITGGDAQAADHRPSTLERLATVTLHVGRVFEAGGDELAAPTTSTTAAMALGDALALAAARRMRFTNADFAKRHPGGALGGMVRPVVELLRFRTGINAPVVSEQLTVGDALQQAELSSRRPGALLLVDSNGVLTGIFTDGDLRRLVLRGADLSTPIASVMTRSPRSLRDNALGRDAVRMIREHRQDEIPVIDEHGRPVGLLDVQDLVTARLVRDEP